MLIFDSEVHLHVKREECDGQTSLIVFSRWHSWWSTVQEIKGAWVQISVWSVIISCKITWKLSIKIYSTKLCILNKRHEQLVFLSLAN